MIKRLLLALACLVALVIIIELVGLALLKYNSSQTTAYWHGRAKQPGDFIYVALGDSAAQGVGASQPQNGYVGLLARDIEQTTKRRVRVINISKSGATLQDALKQQVPQLGDIEPDLVTAEIGANDMKHYSAGQFRQEYEAFIQSLPPGKSVVSDMPYFGSRPNLNRSARDANRIIKELGQQYQIPVAQLYDALSRQQSPLIYASDFFHPNNRGYRIWATAFRQDIEPLLVTKLDKYTY